MQNKVTLSLTREEAIVFFEFLSRFSDERRLEIEDQAEERVLWNLTCDLEKELWEPLHRDYADLLEKARAEVRDTNDSKQHNSR